MSEDGAWYSEIGSDNDVVLSSRVRLARNLANFPFRQRMRGDDRERVKAIVFDAFSRLGNPEIYHTIDLSNMDNLGIKLMTERGVLEEDRESNEGLVIREDGKLSCVINGEDHIRLSAFFAGLDFAQSFTTCVKLDNALQQFIQFAASYDFGYLSSSFKDCGSGMKLSAWIHIPSSIFLKEEDSIFSLLKSGGFVSKPCYDMGFGEAIGSYYQISNAYSTEGNEVDQIASITAACQRIYTIERKCREEMVKKYPTMLKDAVYRAYALARFSRLLSLGEAIQIVSSIKWGVDSGIVGKIDDAKLFSLLYKLQPSHLEFVLKNSSFNFESDVESDNKYKVSRLRSLILQEAFESLEMKE